MRCDCQETDPTFAHLLACELRRAGCVRAESAAFSSATSKAKSRLAKRAEMRLRVFPWRRIERVSEWEVRGRIAPGSILEAPSGFEPEMEVLQGGADVSG